MPTHRHTAAPRRHKTIKIADEFFRFVVESLEAYAILTTDRELRINSWSRGARQLFGYEESEILGRGAGILFTPEDVAKGAPQNEFAEALERGRVQDERWH